MKRTTLLLGIAVITIFSLMTGAYFYQKNEAAMRDVAENLFVQVLQEEVQRKGKDLNLFSSFSGVSVDTLPLTLHITTEEGVKTYQIDSSKSKKNISRNLKERSFHSVICEESGFSPDSLNLLWTNRLKEQCLWVKSAMYVSRTDLKGRTFSTESEKNAHSLSSTCFIAYLGDRCEVEVRGFLLYSWFAVCWFHFFPFVITIGIAVILIILLCFLFRTKKHLLLTQISEECLIAEREKEQQELNHYKNKIEELVNAKEEFGTGTLVYILSPLLVFNLYNNQLIYNGETVKFTPQACALLHTFLTAPDYTLTRSEINLCLWGTIDSDKQSFRTALYRLREALKIDPSVSVLSLGGERFQLKLPPRMQ